MPNPNVMSLERSIAQNRGWTKIKPWFDEPANLGNSNPDWRLRFMGRIAYGAHATGVPATLSLTFLRWAYPSNSRSTSSPINDQLLGQSTHVVYSPFWVR